MDGFDPFPDFRRLLRDFSELDRLAAELISQNPEDDHIIKLAIVGFSANAPTDQWTISHFNEVMQYRSEMPPSDFSRPWMAFACLALGHLLGLYASDRITDLNYLHGVALVPGFMWLEGPDQFDNLLLSG